MIGRSKRAVAISISPRCCQALLDLQVAGEQLHDAAELAQADDPLAREATDVRDTVKWE